MSKLRHSELDWESVLKLKQRLLKFYTGEIPASAGMTNNTNKNKNLDSLNF